MIVLPVWVWEGNRRALPSVMQKLQGTKEDAKEGGEHASGKSIGRSNVDKAYAQIY